MQLENLTLDDGKMRNSVICVYSCAPHKIDSLKIESLMIQIWWNDSFRGCSCQSENFCCFGGAC